MDGEERKIAILYAAFEEINAGLKDALARLEQAVGQVQPTAAKAVRESLTQELAGLRGEVQQTTTALKGMKKAADWRTVWVGAVLIAAAIAVTLLGFWLLTPSPQEMNQLRDERASLQANIDELAARGGRADFKKCGAQGEHLCVRIDPTQGNFGKGDARYLVVYGY